MLPASVRGTLLAVGAGLLLSFPACGKKAPLRLPDSRAAERAPAPRARVREGRVTLEFLVPAHRSFPEREEPWVLARILRQATPSSEVVEAGTVIRPEGFEFDSPLSWSDPVVLQEQTAVVYRVEFRDAIRRRRALSPLLAVSWVQPPPAPSNPTAGGHLRSIILNWTAPGDPGAQLTYRIYRREASRELFEQLTAEPVAETRFVDSRIETDRDYCYEIRALLGVGSLEIEGPASPERCARSAAEAP